MMAGASRARIRRKIFSSGRAIRTSPGLQGNQHHGRDGSHHPGLLLRAQVFVENKTCQQDRGQRVEGRQKGGDIQAAQVGCQCEKAVAGGIQKSGQGDYGQSSAGHRAAAAA